MVLLTMKEKSFVNTLILINNQFMEMIKFDFLTLLLLIFVDLLTTKLNRLLSLKGCAIRVHPFIREWTDSVSSLLLQSELWAKKAILSNAKKCLGMLSKPTQC